VVEVHGGAWSALDRTVGELYCAALAQAGFVVASIDFRQGPAHRHPAASADVAAAVRWLRLSATSFEVDPQRIGLVGSSSGGHLALLAATGPDIDEHRGGPVVVDGEVVDPAGVSAAVACVAALWPPVDPLGRYRYARERAAAGEGDDRFRPKVLVANTQAYFGDEATMAEASVADRVRRGVATHLPPAWVAYPEQDRNVPRALVDDLADAWRAAGGRLDITTYPGEQHAFGHRPGPSTDRFAADLIAFLQQHLAPA
jgi:acetyl esterase